MYFIYDDISSDGILKIKKDSINNLSSPAFTFEKFSVKGKNGDIFISDNSYENFELKMICIMDSRKSNKIEDATFIKRWLQTDLSYKKLILSTDPSLYYEAVCINKLDISQVARNIGEFPLTFSCKPFKKFTKEEVIVINENTTIHNSHMESRPKIKIFGTGDMSITINNQKVSLKKVDKEIEIDSEEMECYVMQNSLISYQNNKMQGDFPILQSGDNRISWIGNITKIEIEPRWAVL